MSAKSIYTVYGATIAKTVGLVGGVVAGVVAAASLMAGITYLGNKRVWY